MDARGRHSAAGGAPIGRAGGGYGADYKKRARRRRAERLRQDGVGRGHPAGSWSPRAAVRALEPRLPALESALLVSRGAPLGARPLAAVARGAPRAPRLSCTCSAPRAPSGRRDERGERRCGDPAPGELAAGRPRPGSQGTRESAAARSRGDLRGRPTASPGKLPARALGSDWKTEASSPALWRELGGGAGGLRSQVISLLLGIPPSASVLPLRGHSGFPLVPGLQRETLSCIVPLRGLCRSCNW